MTAFNEELKLIRTLRRMGATKIELGLVSVTFPEAPVDQPVRRLRMPKVVAQELKTLGVDVTTSPEHDELELARQEMDSFLRDTVG